MWKLALLALLLTGCTRQFIMRTAMAENGEYFAPERYRGTSLDRVAEGVHSFRWKWYRNLIVETDEGLFVTDPMNESAVEAMRAELEREFPGRPVHTLFYTHYHLDHASGGRALAPGRVIAHSKCPEYWARVDSSEVLPATELIDGDENLEIGGVEIRLLYLGDSHTDTLYAVYLPEKRVLFTSDFVLVRSYPAFGIPDAYGPGLEAAGRRLAALDFEVFVPSHFDYGTKQDFLDGLEFSAFHRDLAKTALRELGEPASSESLKEYFDFAYPRMKDRYGDWHGFDQQALELFVHAVVGELLGF